MQNISKQTAKILGNPIYNYLFNTVARKPIKENLVQQILQTSRLARRNTQDIVSNNVDQHCYDLYYNPMERNQAEFQKHVDIILEEVEAGALNHVSQTNEQEKKDVAQALGDLTTFTQVQTLYEQICLLKHDIDHVNYLSLDRFNEREENLDPNCKDDAFFVVEKQCELIDACKEQGLALWESKIKEELGMQVMRMVRVLRLEEDIKDEGTHATILRKFRTSEQFA